jgi:hypothetical protein
MDKCKKPLHIIFREGQSIKARYKCDNFNDVETIIFNECQASKILKKADFATARIIFDKEAETWMK